mmetsp:Transcript_21923/g.31458  ORF Transcript_21923/g.31458 Transcript_21923/m.31458 type:complete len:129 (+) Transcript_21923:2-388(+)
MEFLRRGVCDSTNHGVYHQCLRGRGVHSVFWAYALYVTAALVFWFKWPRQPSTIQSSSSSQTLPPTHLYDHASSTTDDIEASVTSETAAMINPSIWTPPSTTQKGRHNHHRQQKETSRQKHRQVELSL